MTKINDCMGTIKLVMPATHNNLPQSYLTAQLRPSTGTSTRILLVCTMMGEMDREYSHKGDSVITLLNHTNKLHNLMNYCRYLNSRNDDKHIMTVSVGLLLLTVQINAVVQAQQIYKISKI